MKTNGNWRDFGKLPKGEMGYLMLGINLK